VVDDAFFNNATFKNLNDEWHILTSTVVAEEEHKSLHGNPLGIVDSLTRTLKTLLRNEREARIQDGKGKRESDNWPSYFQSVVDQYNRMKHKGIGGETPEAMFRDRYELAKIYEERSAHNSIARQQESATRHPVGTKVRIVSMKTSKLAKGPNLRLSPQVYTITGYHASGNRYRLAEDENKKPKLSDVVRVRDNAHNFQTNSNATRPSHPPNLEMRPRKKPGRKRKKQKEYKAKGLDLFDSDDD